MGLPGKSLASEGAYFCCLQTNFGSVQASAFVVVMLSGKNSLKAKAGGVAIVASTSYSSYPQYWDGSSESDSNRGLNGSSMDFLHFMTLWRSPFCRHRCQDCSEASAIGTKRASLKTTRCLCSVRFTYGQPSFDRFKCQAWAQTSWATITKVEKLLSNPNAFTAFH